MNVGAHHKEESGQRPQAALMLLCAADLPLSYIGDFVTWPYTAAYSFINQPVPTPPVILSTTEPPHQPIAEQLPLKPTKQP